MADLKYKLLKAIDVSGLTFLSPVVRLCYKEEPQKQIKEIVRFIVIPVFAFAMFLVLWSYYAPKHKTKSGEVPTPYVVWDAASSIWTFHVREGSKEDAYGLGGKSREEQIETIDSRLADLKPLEKRADEQVKEAEESWKTEVEDLVAPIRDRYEEVSANLDKDSAEREAALAKKAESVVDADIAEKEAFLQRVRDHLKQSEDEAEILSEIRQEETDLRSEKSPQIKAALRAQTKIAEEQQYLVKLREQLSSNNRGLKVDDATARLNSSKREFVSASSGPEALALATKIVKSEDRIEKIAESSYAKPWTLPLQIYRSVACVFVGFLIGTAIAVPIGILCGLSQTFMAAMTPFIALFKPVSPIVWLPIALIIVGGFIEDPDKHWLIQGLAEAPLIGWMKINPAFIASAITVALCSLWATMVNTALGVASIDKDHLNVARVLKLGFWSRLTKIVIPSSLPLIFAGLRISLGVGWMVLIAAELLSSSEGIGKYVWDQFNNGASDSFAKMMVVVFVVGLIGFLLDRIMIVLQRLVSFDGAPAAM